MADATVSRLGLVNNTGTGYLDLFLKVFSGEVLTTFDEINLMKPLHMNRTISSGKSAQFPVLGTSSASYHDPGTEIVGTAIKHNERNVHIDGLLISHVFISNIDEAVNHYDVRGPYAHQLGQALANKFDKNCLIQAYNGGGQTTTITGGKPSVANQVVITNANVSGATGGTYLAEAVFSIAQKMDENDVPENERYVVLRPIHYYKMVQDTKAINRDWGGAGSYADGEVLRIAGVTVLKSNHLPALANVTSHDASMIQTSNSYIGDFRKVIGVGFHKSAIGTVQLMGLKVESEYDIRRQGHLMVAKFALGTNWLRPESCYQLNYGTNITDGVVI